jgi:hypothetical protein
MNDSKTLSFQVNLLPRLVKKARDIIPPPSALTLENNAHKPLQSRQSALAGKLCLWMLKNHDCSAFFDLLLIPSGSSMGTLFIVPRENQKMCFLKASLFSLHL